MDGWMDGWMERSLSEQPPWVFAFVSFDVAIGTAVHTEISRLRLYPVLKMAVPSSPKPWFKACRTHDPHYHLGLGCTSGLGCDALHPSYTVCSSAVLREYCGYGGGSGPRPSISLRNIEREPMHALFTVINNTIYNNFALQ